MQAKKIAFETFWSETKKTVIQRKWSVALLLLTSHYSMRSFVILPLPVMMQTLYLNICAEAKLSLTRKLVGLFCLKIFYLFYQLLCSIFWILINKNYICILSLHYWIFTRRRKNNSCNCSRICFFYFMCIFISQYQNDIYSAIQCKKNRFFACSIIIPRIRHIFDKFISINLSSAMLFSNSSFTTK